MKRILTAILLALLPAVALAQTFPLTLPQNSVYGRLGIGSGPGQAITMTRLAAALNGQLVGGVARMFPHVSQTASASDCYTLIDPYGNAIACTTSTTTQGLQEFLTAVATNGWKVAEVNCVQGNSQFEAGIINATTSVNVPAFQDQTVLMRGCNLNFVIATSSGLIFDSQGASIFDFDGKIVYNVSSSNGNTPTNPSCPVLIKPHTNTQDGFPGFYAGYLRIKAPVASPTDATKASGVICIDASAGNIIQQQFDFGEVNGGGSIGAGNAYHGIFVINPGAATGFQQNTTRVTQIHGVATDGVNVGWNGTNAANLHSNLWQIGAINANATTARGIDTYGSNDIWTIGQIDAAEGGLGVGLVTESGANYNRFTAGKITGYTTNNYVDSGTCNSFDVGPVASGGSNGSVKAFFGGTSGCTKIATSAGATGTQTLPAGTGPIGAMGYAEMKPFPSQGAGAWQVTDPYGNDISTSGTTCQGLDKLVAAAGTNGWSWRVVGSGTITCTAAISIPTCFKRSEYIAPSVNISFSALGATNAITVDSHENCDTRFLGGISQNAADTGAVIALKPTTNSGAGNTVFAANYIDINSVSPGTGAIGVKMDIGSGGFIGNDITIRDVNGGATGVQVTSPGSGVIAFEHNRIHGIYNHGQTTRVWQIGTSSTNQSNLRYNTYLLGRVDPGTGATVAFDTWESNSAFVGMAITNETASATTGLKFESGANGNIVVGGVVQATTALSDSGSANQFFSVSGITGTLKVSTAFASRMNACVTGVNFNSANTDNALTIPLPTGTTRWMAGRLTVHGASASISTATVGVFTSTGGGGQTIAANQAITVTTASNNTNNNSMALTVTNGNTEAYDVTTVQARVGTPQGSAATGTVCVEYTPLP